MSALEGEMAQLREEWVVVAQAPLIQARLLNSLRETQVEQGRQLQDLGRVQGEHSQILQEHSQILQEHGVALQTIVGMLTTLIEREH